MSRELRYFEHSLTGRFTKFYFIYSLDGNVTRSGSEVRRKDFYEEIGNLIIGDRDKGDLRVISDEKIMKIIEEENGAYQRMMDERNRGGG